MKGRTKTRRLIKWKNLDTALNVKRKYKEPSSDGDGAAQERNGKKVQVFTQPH
jgi:hypothetical protein